jgi:hypothetical protein
VAHPAVRAWDARWVQNAREDGADVVLANCSVLERAPADLRADLIVL